MQTLALPSNNHYQPAFSKAGNKLGIPTVSPLNLTQVTELANVQQDSYLYFSWANLKYSNCLFKMSLNTLKPSLVQSHALDLEDMLTV